MGIIALVLFEIADFIRSGFNPYVSSSISENTGVASTNRTALTVDMNENDGTITSSDAFMLYANNDA